MVRKKDIKVEVEKGEDCWVIEVFITNPQGREQRFIYTTRRPYMVENFLHIIRDWMINIAIEG